MYHVATQRHVSRKFVDIARHLYLKYSANNHITSVDKLLYGYAAIVVVSKFWEDEKYVIENDYCYAMGISTKEGCEQIYRCFWDVEMKLLESIGFKLMELSEEVLKK